MASTDSTLSTLTQIRTKVRRLTRSPSSSQLTNDQIDDYVNTFVLYDFPEFTVDNQVVFFTMPNVDEYFTNTDNEDDPLFNFKNIYLSVQPPAYIAGEEVALTQTRDQFFREYPKTEAEEIIGAGDSVTVAFTGTLATTPVLANTVSFSSIDDDGNGIVLNDLPQYDGVTGLQLQTGDLVEPDSTTSVGVINYLTGVYSFTFPLAPGNGENVIAQTFRYAAAKPRSILYEDRTFTLRPVPDKVYRVEIDAFKRPTELLNVTDEPDVAQWWQYIAYGASKKVFEDRMDVESIQAITPEFLRQRSLVLQKLVVQQSSERTATIYTDRGAGFYVDRDSF
jgi:hypothetical protein